MSLRGMRQRFWLAAMDVVAALGGYGSRLYLWCVGKASDATDWGVTAHWCCGHYLGYQRNCPSCGQDCGCAGCIADYDSELIHDDDELSAPEDP